MLWGFKAPPEKSYSYPHRLQFDILHRTLYKLRIWLTILRNGLGEDKYKELGLPEPVGTREIKEIKFEKIKDL